MVQWENLGKGMYRVELSFLGAMWFNSGIHEYLVILPIANSRLAKY